MKSMLFFSSCITLIVTSGVLPAALSIPGDTPESITLPAPITDGKTSLETALTKRRSVRHYKDIPLSLADLSQLLWAGQGITASAGRRTAPSAGALYPLEMHVVAGKVTGLPPAVYRYQPQDHTLHRIKDGDVRAELCTAALGQSSIKQAPVVIVVSAVYERTTVKYGERGVRYVHMEAGHAAQNISLQAASLDCGTVVVGAFHDDQVGTVLNLPREHHPLSLLPVGKR